MAKFQQRPSQSTIHSDPVRNFKFVVKFQPNTATDFFKDSASTLQPQLGFMSVSGLSVATEPIPYREGGDNTTPRKLPGQSNFSDITLSRGVVIGSRRNWLWLQRIFHAVQGQGSATSAGPDAHFRFNMDIFVLDHPTNSPAKTPAKVAFRVYNAWPSSLAYSDLDAGGNAVLIEQMTLTHEGWEMRWATGDSGEKGTPSLNAPEGK